MQKAPARLLPEAFIIGDQMALGWQRFFLSFATRPQLLQMNAGLFTRGIISLTSRSHAQHVKAHILSAPAWCPSAFGLIVTLLGRG
jgi:hypothetical protein